MADDDPVQPDEGQGGESGGAAPWAEYLDRIPEQVRPDVEPVFRDWDANTTRRFQEASEYRKQWEPFEQLGVQERDPDAVQWALEVADAATQNPAEFQKWVNNTFAEANGLTPAEAQEALSEQYVDPDVQALVDQQLKAQLGPMAEQVAEFAEWRSAQEQREATEQAEATIRSELDELKAKHPGEYNEEFIEMFIPRHMESNPGKAVQLAFEDSQRIVAQIEKDVLHGKANAPLGAESGGVPDGTPEKVDTLAKAAEVARQMLRANNAQ